MTKGDLRPKGDIVGAYGNAMRSSLPYCGGTSASFTLLSGIVDAVAA